MLLSYEENCKKSSLISKHYSPVSNSHAGPAQLYTLLPLLVLLFLFLSTLVSLIMSLVVWELSPILCITWGGNLRLSTAGSCCVGLPAPCSLSVLSSIVLLLCIGLELRGESGAAAILFCVCWLGDASSSCDGLDYTMTSCDLNLTT